MELAGHLKPSRRVLALDFRGRGRSDFDPDYRNYFPTTYADDVVEWLDHLGIGSAVFCGTSLGGIVTMVLAEQAPELFAGAIINDIGPEVSMVGILRIAQYVGKLRPAENWDDAIANTKIMFEVAFPDADAATWDLITKAHLPHRRRRQAGPEIRSQYRQGVPGTRRFAPGPLGPVRETRPVPAARPARRDLGPIGSGDARRNGQAGPVSGHLHRRQPRARALAQRARRACRHRSLPGVGSLAGELRLHRAPVRISVQGLCAPSSSYRTMRLPSQSWNPVSIPTC